MEWTEETNIVLSKDILSLLSLIPKHPSNITQTAILQQQRAWLNLGKHAPLFTFLASIGSYLSCLISLSYTPLLSSCANQSCICCCVHLSVPQPAEEKKTGKNVNYLRTVFTWGSERQQLQLLLSEGREQIHRCRKVMYWRVLKKYLKVANQRLLHKDTG